MIVDLASLKTYLRNEGVAYDDQGLVNAELTAEVLLADITGRTWNVATGTPSARLYVPRGDDVLRIHDCVSVTSVVAGTSSISSTAYQLEPVNQLTWSGQYRPYEQIRMIYGFWYQYGRKATISVTADWGWSAFPSPIVEAAKVLTKDVLAHRDVKFGLVGITDYGGVRARQATLITDLTTNFARAEKFGIA